MLSDELLLILQAGLARKAINSCSDWALKYRIMGKPFPGPWSFKYFAWLKEPMDATCTRRVIPKGAQLGWTEAALNRVLYKIDVMREDCLYLLPKRIPDASNFSAARFDGAIELSTHLQTLFSDVKNIGHKRAGSVNLYIRGMQSKSALKSIPAGNIFRDEFNEMPKDNVILVEQRAAGQLAKEIWDISTPTHPSVGVSEVFPSTSQEHFFFKCPKCGRFTEFKFPDSLVVTATELNDPEIKNSYYKCLLCHNKLEHELKHEYLQNNQWVPQAERFDPDIRGFYINQFYSSANGGHPLEQARKFILSQYDQVEEAEFYNSNGGLPYAAKGSQVTEEAINNCIADYVQETMVESPTRLVTMGVDVGTVLHVEIAEWNIPSDLNPVDISIVAKPRILKITTVRNFEELDIFMRDFQVQGCVIDAQPERRKAKEFADRFFGFVKTCFYVDGTKRLINLKDDTAADMPEHVISVDRTGWLDLSLGRFEKSTILLPKDTPQMYRDQVRNQVKITRKNDKGDIVSRYEAIGADHYGHARNYNEIALLIAYSQAHGTDIRDLFNH